MMHAPISVIPAKHEESCHICRALRGVKAHQYVFIVRQVLLHLALKGTYVEKIDIF